MLLRNKNAVISGGGGAIGGAVARAFAREGARVFLAGRTLAKAGCCGQGDLCCGRSSGDGSSGRPRRKRRQQALRCGCETCGKYRLMSRLMPLAFFTYRARLLLTCLLKTTRIRSLSTRGRTSLRRRPLRLTW